MTATRMKSEAVTARATSDADAGEVWALFLEMKRAAARPDSVEGLQAYANSQQDAAEYELCHWLAAYVGALAAGTPPPARATYQAPPRRPAWGAAAPMIASADTKKEITQ